MSVAMLARKTDDADPAKVLATSMSASSGLRISKSSPVVRETPRSPVQDRSADGLVENRFGHDFGKVKVHAHSQPLTARAPSRVIPLAEAEAGLRREDDRRTARILANGPVRFRVPTTADMKVLFSSGSVPQDVLKDRIRVALSRMAAEKRLKSKDSVDEIMKKVFPAAGGFDEAAYEEAVDVTDRSKVYQSVLDAETKVTAADKPKLKTTMEQSGKLIDDCVADDTNLQSVFGTKKGTAKNVYKQARTALNHAITNTDSKVTTDYNLDDPETGLGGWATFNDQRVHFESSVTKVTNEKEAKVTIIHEASHLADPSVTDEGRYYGTAGFEAASETEKVTNAAHYEEIPRRKLGTSEYKLPDGGFRDFKPGTSSAGAPLTFSEKVKGKADNYFRKAWDKAVDVHGFVRDIRKAEVGGDHAPFNAHKARLLEISKLTHLTIHEQPAATATVNQVDVVLTEGVARAAGIMEERAAKQPVYNPFELKMPPLSMGFKPERPSLLPRKLELQPMPELKVSVIQTEDEAVNQVIDATIKQFGNLTGNEADDRKLLDWLVAEYKKDL